MPILGLLSTALLAMTVRHIRPVSLARVVGAIYVFFGAFAALGVGCAAYMYEPVGSEFEIFTGAGSLLMLLFYPVVFGLIGVVTGAVTAVLYNLVAAWIGGVELDVERRKRL